MKRDLLADLTICEAATPGPWRRVTKYEQAIVNADSFSDVVTAQGDDACYIDIEPEDERFIIEAREGWPEAIRRAIAAEAENERLYAEIHELYKAFDNGVPDGDFEPALDGFFRGVYRGLTEVSEDGAA